jgi:hypothetical protein
VLELPVGRRRLARLEEPYAGFKLGKLPGANRHCPGGDTGPASLRDAFLPAPPDTNRSPLCPCLEGFLTGFTTDLTNCLGPARQSRVLTRSEPVANMAAVRSP